MKEKRPKDKTYFYYAGLGIDLVASTVAGGLIGYFLDRYFETSPWLMIVFGLLGVISGFLTVFKTLERIEKR